MLHFIHHQPITISKITAGASGICSGKIRYFTFSFIHGSLSVGLLAISVSACSFNAVISDYYMSYSLYNMLSHFVFFNSLGGVKCTHVISSSRCIYTCPVWTGMRPRHQWFERSDLKRVEFRGLVFSLPEQTHEVTRCKP